jgi:hypothetical protein
MIVYKANHWFDAMFPSLEDGEKEIFYQHPLYDIKVNQLGVIYCDNSVFGIYDKVDTSMVRSQITRNSIGTKTRIIWECYTGEILNTPHFFFVNANPLDTRKENMVLSGPLSAKDRAPYLRTKNSFIQASVEHLMKVEDRMEKVGVDQTQLHELLLLPQWLKSARKKYLPPKPPKQQKKYSKGTPKTRSTPEEIAEVIKLYNMGLTFYAIIDRMGWTSTSRIKKIAKDYNLVR